MARVFRVGDPVIYRKQKFSRHPGRNAVAIYPAAHGDDYCYCVEKFWRVVAVLPDGNLAICTRRGKRHTVAADDPALRPASWWERLLYRRRFPAPVPAEQARAQAPPELTACDAAVATSRGARAEQSSHDRRAVFTPGPLP